MSPGSATGNGVPATTTALAHIPMCKPGEAFHISFSRGVRLRAYLKLGIAGIDFDQRWIDWTADNDKRRKTRRSPLAEALAPDLKPIVERRKREGSPFVFVHPDNPMQSLDKDRADTMLERAYKVAGVKHRKGGLWHPFLARLAMKLKGLPLTDVAETGGWDVFARCLLATSSPIQTRCARRGFR